jgi:hypothetical protein
MEGKEVPVVVKETEDEGWTPLTKAAIQKGGLVPFASQIVAFKTNACDFGGLEEHYRINGMCYGYVCSLNPPGDDDGVYELLRFTIPGAPRLRQITGLNVLRFWTGKTRDHLTCTLSIRSTTEEERVDLYRAHSAGLTCLQ